MDKFRVGDFIKGKKDNGYGWTNEQMLKAEVVNVHDNSMDIKCIEHTDSFHVGNSVTVTNSSDLFELLILKKPTREEVIKMPIGTRITTDEEDYNVFVKVGEDEWCNDDADSFDSCDINDNLTIDYEGKIVKIEVPEYKTIYDYSRGQKEMTIAEIEKELGYSIKVVKED